MMKYKEYIATVQYDDSIELFHGRVINAAPYPIATFQASDVEGLKREFQTSVEDYLAWCKEDGVEPLKPFSGKLVLRLGPELHQRVAASAMRKGMSINGWIKYILDREAETL